MAKCSRCGKKFNVSDAKDEYHAEFGGELDGDFDDLYGREVCGGCAINDTNTNINIGRAIDMSNGDEDYDADHMEKYL